MSASESSSFNGQGFRHTYPLHLAVVQENAEITSLLLVSGCCLWSRLWKPRISEPIQR